MEVEHKINTLLGILGKFFEIKLQDIVYYL